MNTYLVNRNSDWSPLSEFRREMDRLFDDFWLDRPTTTTRSDRDWFPACEVEENEDHYLMNFEMPGISKDQIRIECVENQLTVSGERNRGERRSENALTYSEHHYGRFQRSFALPAGLNADKIEASYQDGILRLYIPKAESAKPRQIKISNGSGTGFFGKLIGQSPREKEEAHSSETKKEAS